MNKKYTKRALFASVMALILCCAMLVGTTMAWFTDSASTAGNTIQSGKLELQLLDAKGESLEGKPLTFIKAADAPENEAILWEPGCTYNLETVTIKNAGNLALKYEFTISGFQGDVELLEVIEWTINDAAVKEFKAEGQLLPGEAANFAISASMMKTAGNEYQNKKLESIAINVAATQAPVEYDSTNNTYDADAKFPEFFTPDDVEEGAASLSFAADANVTLDPEAEGFTGLDFIENNGGNVTYGAGVYKAGTPGNAEKPQGNYASINNGGTATYNNSDIESFGGGIAVTDGANVVFNSGSVYVNTKNTSGKYNFYVVGEGSELTINDGNFSWNPSLNNKRAYIYAGAGATVYVKGGTFGPASTRSGYTAGIMGDGTVIITGGTFGFNPSAWVADGYKATETDGIWTVSAI